MSVPHWITLNLHLSEHWQDKHLSKPNMTIAQSKGHINLCQIQAIFNSFFLLSFVSSPFIAQDKITVIYTI